MEWTPLINQEEDYGFTPKRTRVFKRQEKKLNIPDCVREHLTSKFVPTDILPTPFIQDLQEGRLPNEEPRYLQCKNPHPRDKRIVACDDPHVYFIDGSCEHMISSTGLVHAFFNPFNKEKTARNVLTSKTFLKTGHRPSHTYFGCKNVQDVLKRWDNWRDLGTALHDNIERFINGEEFEVVAENEKPFNRFMKFYNDRAFWTWTHFRTEWAIFDEDSKLAGKIDYCGIFPNGEIIILDWKRVRSISDSCVQRWTGGQLDMGHGVCSQLENCKYITYSLQLNVYKWILEKNYGYRVRSMFLVQVHPKVKNPVIYKVPNLSQWVNQMIECRIRTLESL